MDPWMVVNGCAPSVTSPTVWTMSTVGGGPDANHYWDRRSFWVGVVGVAIALVTLLVGLREFLPDEVTAEEHIAVCQDTHNVTVQQDPEEEADAIRKSCTWPPAPGTSEDGLGVVVVDAHVKPTGGTADPEGVVWTFTSSCDRLRIDWRAEGGGNGGLRFAVDERTYDTGQMVTLDGEPSHIPTGLENVLRPPAVDELFVVMSGHVYPHYVECVR